MALSRSSRLLSLRSLLFDVEEEEDEETKIDEEQEEVAVEWTCFEDTSIATAARAVKGRKKIISNSEQELKRYFYTSKSFTHLHVHLLY